MAKSETAPQGPAPPLTAEAIERWFGESFRDSVVAQNTPCWNHVRAAVDRLKRLAPTS